jgi:hypothetical protein
LIQLVPTGPIISPGRRSATWVTGDDYPVFSVAAAHRMLADSAIGLCPSLDLFFVG